MKFGVCAGIEEAPTILAAGFDYVEVGASRFAGMSETWDPAPYRDVPILATNLFLDSRIKLFGPDRTPYLAYSKTTVQRAAELGIHLMVIGSGASRRSYEGSGGDQEFIAIVAEIQDFASGLGIQVAPESLNRSETNVGNDLRNLALGLRDRGVGFTADSYHVLVEWDADGRLTPLESLWIDQISFAPTHVHIADLPRLGVDAGDPLLAGFASRLRDLGYQGAVSLECTRGPDFDYPSTLAALRTLLG